MTSSSSATSELKAAKDRGAAHYAAGRWAEAISAYSYCIDHAPTDDPELHLYYSNRCAAHMQLKDFRRAKDDADAVISLKPTWPKGYSRLGSALLQLGKRQEAIYALERCVELDPANREAVAALQRARGGSGGGSTPFSGFPGGMGGGLGGVLATAQRLLSQAVSSAMLAWAGLSPTQRQVCGWGVVAVLAYYFFFTGGDR
jgi:tetratricopeptide (TPR) repeat protein